MELTEVRIKAGDGNVAIYEVSIEELDGITYPKLELVAVMPDASGKSAKADVFMVPMRREYMDSVESIDFLG